MELSACVNSPASIVLGENSLKWPIILVGIIVLCIMIGVYIAYRYIKDINCRFSKLEEILGRLIEKNNQIQHALQAPQNIMYASVPIPPPQPTVVQQSQPTIIQQPQPTVPSSPVISQSQPAVNLDQEIEKELKELEVEQGVSEEKEGRIDAEEKI
jgi:hypothetical protein